MNKIKKYEGGGIEEPTSEFRSLDDMLYTMASPNNKRDGFTGFKKLVPTISYLDHLYTPSKKQTPVNLNIRKGKENTSLDFRSDFDLGKAHLKTGLGVDLEKKSVPGLRLSGNISYPVSDRLNLNLGANTSGNFNTGISYRFANGGKPYPGPPYYPYHSANLKVDKSYDKNHVQPSVFEHGGPHYIDSQGNPTDQGFVDNTDWAAADKWMAAKQALEAEKERAAALRTKLGDEAKYHGMNMSSREEAGIPQRTADWIESIGGFACNTYSCQMMRNVGMTTADGSQMPILPGNASFNSRAASLGWELQPKGTLPNQKGDLVRGGMYDQSSGISNGSQHSMISAGLDATDDTGRTDLYNNTGDVDDGYSPSSTYKMEGGDRQDYYTTDSGVMRYVGNTPALQKEFDALGPKPKVDLQLNKRAAAPIQIEGIQPTVPQSIEIDPEEQLALQSAVENPKKFRRQNRRLDNGGPTDPDKEYLKNWNKARLKTGRFNDQLGSGRIEGLNQNIDEVERVSRAEMSELIGEDPNSRGMYYRDSEKGMHTYFSEPTFLQEFTSYFGGMPQTNLHELTHAMTKASSHIPGEESTGQIKAIQNIPLGAGEYYGSEYSKMSPEGKYDVGPYGYDGDAEEILAQLMEYRKNFNVDPNRIFTEDDIEEVMKNVKKQGARGLFGLDVYEPKELIRLMNEVAMVDDKKSDINMARNGGPTDPPKKELEIQPAASSTTYVDKPVFDRDAFSEKIAKELGVKPDTSNENFHKTAKSYVEREKVIDREPISGIRSMLPYPCYDYTCVELLKDADKDIGRNSIPGNINNNRELREYLLNNPNYSTVHRDSTEPGDLIQYYDPANNNYPYHAGIVDTDSSYISSGGGTPYFPIGNPVEIKGLNSYNTLDGDQPGTEWYGESKDPYYAYRYIEQD